MKAESILILFIRPSRSTEGLFLREVGLQKAGMSQHPKHSDRAEAAAQGTGGTLDTACLNWPS